MIYARMHEMSGRSVVAEIIDPPGPVEEYYAPEFVAALIEAPTGAAEGWVLEDGVLVPPPPAAPVNLPALKGTLCAQIDVAAEVERARYITPGAGQAMTYQAKAAEALALAADPAPDPAAYPLLSAEVGITAPDLAGVGAVVRGAYAAWQVIGAGIERARLAGKAAVMAAEDEASARAAAAVEWPAPTA
ncbi:hypothetical protein [Xanthobacter sediminis]|uniref:hypothetical protein n=1 Tax=Xanthobacter sediminis TaxID=3119926 RepID=UPI00372C85A3